MSCHTWNEEWVGLLYDDLEPADAERARAHLAGCAACRLRLERLQLARQQLRAADPVPPAAPRLVLATPPTRWRPWLAFAAGLICAAFLFGLGASLGRGGRPADDPALGELASRLERLEATPAANVGTIPTHDELQRAIERLENRLRAERAEELQYLMRSITATELRTGSRIDHTQQALQLLALRQEPGFTER